MASRKVTAKGRGAGKSSSILCKSAELTDGTIIAKSVAVEYRADTGEKKRMKGHTADVMRKKSYNNALGFSIVQLLITIAVMATVT